jgi:hypothetical protein
MKPFLGDKRSDWPEGIAVFGFFGGSAFLTALSFSRSEGSGYEAAPFGEIEYRENGWAEKMTVLTVGVILAGLIACFVQTAFGILDWKELRMDTALEPILLLVIVVCSTGFWTLLARSLIGGIVLTAAAQVVLYLLLVLFVTLINRMAPASPGTPNLVHEPGVHSALSWFVAGFGLSYAGLMLWLGRQKFAKMEQRRVAVAG